MFQCGIFKVFFKLREYSSPFDAASMNLKERKTAFWGRS